MDDRPGEKGKGLLCGSAIEVILGIPCHAYHALAAMVYFPSNSSHIAALMQAMFSVNGLGPGRNERRSGIFERI